MKKMILAVAAIMALSFSAFANENAAPTTTEAPAAEATHEAKTEVKTEKKGKKTKKVKKAEKKTETTTEAPAAEGAAPTEASH